MSCTARASLQFRGHEATLSGYGQGRIELSIAESSGSSKPIASCQVSSSNSVTGLYVQPLDVLGRFEDDLFFVWADCSSGLDPRVDLIAVKLSLSTTNSTGTESVVTSCFRSCFSIDDSDMLVNSSLMDVQVSQSVSQ